MKRLLILVPVIGALAAAGQMIRSKGSTELDTMVQPAYDENGELVRPEGYRSWMFVGASLGLRYPEEGEPPDEGPGTFHNVYIQPEAYRYFLENGVFPEKTMLPMETYLPGSRESIGQMGYFEKDFAGLSVAVKDRARFEEGWGYVSFKKPGGGLLETGPVSPREACYDCHRAHGAHDNVFTQFYPILR